ncbi:hypothetical protein MK489_24870, partial [Myxococcota bacterium]|nr:hypothetical protein [Myxococcota bacterium]
SGQRKGSLDLALFIASFVIALACTLYSFDTGPFFVIGIALFGGVAILSAREEKCLLRRVRRGVIVLSAAVLLGLLVSMVLVVSWPSQLTTVRDLADLVLEYRLTMNKPFSSVTDLVLWGTSWLAAAGTILWLHRELKMETLRRDFSASRFATLMLLLAANALSAVWLAYGVTRSDGYHVKLACMPIVFSAVFLVSGHLRTRDERRALLLIGCGFALTVAIWQIQKPKNSVDRISAILSIDPRAAEWKVTAKSLKAGIEAAEKVPMDSLFVWPYQSLVSTMLDRRDPIHTVQVHMATTRELDRRNVELMSTRESPMVLLILDSWQIDDVPNPSRSPAMFSHLLKRFELASSPYQHSAILLERLGDERSFDVLSLPVPQWDGHSFGVDLRGYDLRATDTLWLRFRTRKAQRLLPFMRPGRLWVAVHLSNGEVRNNPYLVRADGEVERLWIETLSPENDLMLVPFLPGPRNVRSLETVDRVEVTWKALGVLTGKNPELVLEGLEVWRVESERVREVSVEAQTHDEIWRWAMSAAVQTEEQPHLLREGARGSSHFGWAVRSTRAQ